MTQITSNMEDYLEAVLLLKERNQVARVRDLSDLLGVKNSSVNSALNVLADKGLIEHEHYGYIDLTKSGEKLAQEIYQKHTLLKSFLSDFLGVDEKNAAEDACQIEHSLSQETFQRLSCFVDFIQKASEEKQGWLKDFQKVCRQRMNSKTLEK